MEHRSEAKSRDIAAGSERQPGVTRGELLRMKPVERFDLEGWQQPKGEWRPGGIVRMPETGADNGSNVMSSPCSASKPNGAEEPGIERARDISGVEAKEQGGSIDLVMVAKASLRASERPFRVSGSGRMPSLRMRSCFDPARAERRRRRARTMNREHPAADRTPSMPVVRSIVP